MTLDAAEIDLGDAFEPGMGYVALSRVRRLDGLKLMNLNEMALSVHPNILVQDKVFKQHSFDSEAYLQKLSPDDIQQLQTQTLIDRFDRGTAKKGSRRKQAMKNKKIPSHLITLEMFKKNHSIEAIATERGFANNTILNHIELLHSLQLIDDSELNCLRPTMTDDAFDKIYSALSASEDDTLSRIYYLFDQKYSYENIRLVRLFVKRCQ
jgi:hypothetical protein